MPPRAGSCTRILHSADSILLPFLAPRAFAEWPEHLRYHKRHQHDQAQKQRECGAKTVQDNVKTSLAAENRPLNACQLSGKAEQARHPFVRHHSDGHGDASTKSIGASASRSPDSRYFATPRRGQQTPAQARLSDPKYDELQKQTRLTSNTRSPRTPFTHGYKEINARQRTRRDAVGSSRNSAKFEAPSRVTRTSRPQHMEADSAWFDAVVQETDEEALNGFQAIGHSAKLTPDQMFEPEDKSQTSTLRKATVISRESETPRKGKGQPQSDQEGLFESYDAEDTMHWSFDPSQVSTSTANQTPNQNSAAREGTLHAQASPVTMRWEQSMRALYARFMGRLSSRRSGSDHFHSHWKRYGTPLAEATSGNTAAAIEPMVMSTQIDLAQSWILEMGGALQEDVLSETMLKSWAALPRDLKAYRWPFIMLYYLASNERHALVFLSQTLSHFRPPIDQVANVFDLAILRVIYAASERDATSWTRRLLGTVKDAIESYDEPLPLSQGMLCKLPRYGDPREVVQVYELLAKKEVYMNQAVRLFFLQPMLRGTPDVKRRKTALDALLGAYRRKRKVKKHRIMFRNGVSRLLHVCRVSTDPGLDFQQCFQSLLAAGIFPATPVLNEMLVAAGEQGSLETQRGIYEQFSQRGLTRSSETYAIMLDAMVNKQDMTGWDSIKAEIEEKPILLRRAPYLALACLRAIHVSHPPGGSFSAMLEFYEKYWKLEPLKKLGIVNTSYKPPVDSSNTSLFLPGPIPLAFMLFVYAREMADTNAILGVYSNLIQHCEARDDPTMLKLSSNPMTWNIILRRLNDAVGADRFELWPQVLRHMTRKLKQVPRPWYYRPAQPDEYTWSIIVHGLSRRGKTEEAEEVIKVMRQFGYLPVAHTWTSLLLGYSLTQNLLGVSTTLGHMADADIPFTEHTHKAMEAYRQRWKLAEAVQRVREARKDPYFERPPDELFEESDAELKSLGRGESLQVELQRFGYA